jgi:leucyl aminopeptidase
MAIQLINRRVYLQLFVLFVFLLFSVILIVSGSVKSFAEESEKDSSKQPDSPVSSKQTDGNSVRESFKSSPIRWLTVDESELKHIQNVVQNKGGSFDLKIVEKHERLSVIQSDEPQILDLTRGMHEEFHKCAGFMSHETLEAARLSIEETLRAESNQSIAAYTIDNQANINPMLAEAKEAEILETITRLSTDFPNRRYNQPSGLDSANWIKNKWTQLAAGRSDMTVEFFNHPAATSPQPSIILTVQGTTLPNEVVVLGGHQDSINHSGAGATGNAPGADDDASGIGSLTEVIRVMVAKNFRPARTVKFMAYAAEEVGLIGSTAIAADFQARAVNVVGVLQLDMTNYKSPSATYDIRIVTDWTNAAQNQFLRDLMQTYQPSVAVADGTCGYSCSDHASWTNKGFPASFPYEPYPANQTIHTTSDTLTQSGNNANHAVLYTKLALSYAGELAKGTVGLSYEGDVASRPNGDGSIQSNDVVQMRTFLTNPDMIDPTGSEFQRADSAPFDTKGDGILASNDVVQVRRYITTDALQAAGGPMQSNLSTVMNRVLRNDWLNASASPRKLRVENADSSRNRQVTINIRADSAGDEAEYGFSLGYDPDVLSNPQITGGDSAGAAVRTCFNNSAGQLNCSVGGFPNDQTGSSSAGIGENGEGSDQILLKVTFTVAANAAAGATGLTLTDVNSSNDRAESLAMTSTNGMVNLYIPTAASTISGRVMNGDGAGIKGVTVLLRNNAAGQTLTTTTGENGTYRFENLAPGGDYVVTPQLAKHSFSPASKSVSLSDELTETDFVIVSKKGKRQL